MTNNLEELEQLPVDSGMDAATVEKAEWLWMQLPILTRWHTQPTYVKALVCRAIRKIEADATAREVEGLRKQLAETADLAFATQQDSIRLAGEVEELRRDLAAIPCQTAGEEDYEPGCCAPCRARADRAALEGKGG